MEIYESGFDYVVYCGDLKFDANQDVVEDFRLESLNAI
jgi:hypothetical protein